jgi:hypothetical protein
MRYIKVAYLVFLLLLLLPLAQYLLPFIDEGGMHGQVIETPKPKFTTFNFNQLIYQDSLEKYISQHFGFRKTVLRLRNQVYYSVYNQAPDAKLFLGKNKTVYENLYVDEYFGNTWAGEDYSRRMITDMKRLQDSLARHHKMLFVVIAPSKAFYASENLSASRDITPENPERNYDAFLRQAKKQGLQFVDFNAWFLQQKGKTEHPLYQPGGSHWTIYGASLAFDSMYRQMRHHFLINEQKDFPELKIKRFYAYEEGNDADYDAVTLFNLLFPPHKEPAFFPEMEIQKKGKYIPRVLGITDSYYGAQILTRLPDSCFASPDYWFMNAKLMPETKYDTIPRGEDFLAKQLQQHDIILYMFTPHNIVGAGWGFTENALSLFDPPDSSRTLFDYLYEKKKLESEQYIRADKNWLHAILLQARKEGLNADTLLEKNVRAVSGN